MTTEEFESILCGQVKLDDELLYIIIAGRVGGKTTDITLHNGECWTLEHTPDLIERAEFIPEKLTDSFGIFVKEEKDA